MAVILCAIAAVWLALAVPVTSLSARLAGDGETVALETAGLRAELTADAPVRFSGSGSQSLSVTAGRLAAPAGRLGDDRMALARLMADAGPLEARFTDRSGIAHTIAVSRRTTAPGELPAAYWLGLVFAVLGALFGLTVWSVRPGEAAAACYAGIGLLLFASELPYILDLLTGLATPGWLVMGLDLASAVLLQAFAILFAALFALFPRPLFSPRTLRIGLGLAALAGLTAVILVPVTGGLEHLVLQLAEYLALLGLLLVQFWIGRKDPLRRPSLIILLGTILMGLALYAVIALLPMMGALPAVLQQEVSFPLFVLIYAGIGMAVMRTSLLSLDGWVRDLMLSIGFLAAVLLADIALLALVTRQQDVALGLAFAAAALVYFPLREGLARRREARRHEHARQALRMAADLAFATTDSARAERWKAAIEATFRPLEIAVDPHPVDRPELDRRGEFLRLPRLGGAPALRCRYAEAGRRAFGPGDVEAAEALIAMTERLIAGRDAYTAGASEERQRIARDLHDDVSGRLMISLHRPDAETARRDIREAMADIRTIVSGLAGQPRLLGELLADMREESRSRCDAVDIELCWPDSAQLADPRPLDYAVYRHIQALVRECVSNAIRHSGGRRIEVATAVDGDRLEIAVSDDGRGLSGDPGDTGQGHGLRNCAERAAALGGRFDILSPPSGSQVRFSVRLAAPAPGEPVAAPGPPA